MAALEATKTAQGDSSGVLGGFGGRFVFWSLPSGFKHYLVGKLIGVAGALL